VTEFLDRCRAPLSRFVLLDHMDWMSGHQPQALVAEWEAILRRASSGARAIFRSAHARPAYLEAVSVEHDGRTRPLRELLRFHRALARRLSLQDRVHTYAGYHIADIEVGRC
jgi:S-adenosylmethionine-diacylglycerol 3-amino-3-carboxypropyl transferase